MIGLLRSFGYAFQGVVACLLGERNFRIHTLAGAMAIAMGAYYQLSGTQWAVLLLAIALVLCCEAVNTAVEAAVDLVSPGEHPLAKLAKDCAAGAVLLAAAGSVGVGFCLFGDLGSLFGFFSLWVASPARAVGSALLLSLCLLYVFCPPWWAKKR